MVAGSGFRVMQPLYTTAAHRDLTASSVSTTFLREFLSVCYIYIYQCTEIPCVSYYNQVIWTWTDRRTDGEGLLMFPIGLGLKSNLWQNTKLSVPDTDTDT